VPGCSGTGCLLPLLARVAQMCTKSGAGACFGGAMGSRAAPSTPWGEQRRACRWATLALGAEHAQGGQHPTVTQQPAWPPAAAGWKRGGHPQWSTEVVGESGGRGEGKVFDRKSNVFTSLGESSPRALFHEHLHGHGEEGLLAQRALGMVPFGLQQSGREESSGGWGGGY